MLAAKMAAILSRGRWVKTLTPELDGWHSCRWHIQMLFLQFVSNFSWQNVDIDWVMAWCWILKRKCLDISGKCKIWVSWTRSLISCGPHILEKSLLLIKGPGNVLIFVKIRLINWCLMAYIWLVLQEACTYILNYSFSSQM